MSRWRPKLVVRTARGGGISSPTNTTGFVFFGLIGLVLSASMVLVAMREAPWALVALVATLLPVHDATAWLLANEAERESFLSQIAQLEGAGVSPSPSHVRMGSGRPIWVLLLGAAGVASLIAGWQVHPALLVLSMFLFSFAVANAVDMARRAFQKT